MTLEIESYLEKNICKVFLVYVILYEFLSFHVLNIVFHNLDKGKRKVFLHYDFSYEYEAYTMPIIVYYFDSYFMVPLWESHIIWVGLWFLRIERGWNQM